MKDDFTKELERRRKELRTQIKNNEMEIKQSTDDRYIEHYTVEINKLFNLLIELESHIDTRKDRKSMQWLLGFLICSTFTIAMINFVLK